MRRMTQIDTKLIHAGEPEPRIEGAVAMPIFQSAVFEGWSGQGYHDIHYIRLNNTPNHTALHAKLAALENAEAALVTGSGMAAISTSLLTVLSAGDHLLAHSSLYGGTLDLIKDLPSFGISYDFIDADDPESWKGLLKSNTRAIYVETMTSGGFDKTQFTEAPPLAATRRLVDGYEKASSEYLSGLGFLYGTEVVDLQMVATIGALMKRCTGLRTLPWVDIHVQQEPGHVESSTLTLDQPGDQSGDQSLDQNEQHRVVTSAEEMWTLWIDFFKSIRQEILSHKEAQKAQ